VIGKLNHVAIATSNLEEAAKRYREVLGAEVSEAVDMPEHGVTTIFVTLANTRIELISPLGDASPIAKFLAKHPDGGIHHICYEVADIAAAKKALVDKGVRILGDGEPQIGAHGKPVLFLHPKDMGGVLVEIEEA
jgi:methylmalonyl-CoA/ethylmalonyl-CoA epimerase